jgi:hypothetical protein
VSNHLQVPDQPDNEIRALGEAAGADVVGGDEGVGDVDISLLRVSLAMTPWERMHANDDALNFAESLCAAMEKRHAKSQ